MVDLLQDLGLWLLIKRIILAETFFTDLFHTLSNMRSHTILQYTKVFSLGLRRADFLSNVSRTAVPLFLAYVVKLIVHSCRPPYTKVIMNCA
jgi:hypothetical protein